VSAILWSTLLWEMSSTNDEQCNCMQTINWLDYGNIRRAKPFKSANHCIDPKFHLDLESPLL
jgi:hypothetical protein